MAGPFFVESFFYLLAAGSLQAIGALLVAPLFLVIARRRTGQSVASLFCTYWFFNLMLLLWGCLGHYAFTWLTFGRLYVSADRIVDWFAFIPFGQWVLDQTFGDQRGYLIGQTTLWQLRLIWFAFAAPVWWMAYVSTTFVVQQRLPRFLSPARA